MATVWKVYGNYKARAQKQTINVGNLCVPHQEKGSGDGIVAGDLWITESINDSWRIFCAVNGRQMGCRKQNRVFGHCVVRWFVWLFVLLSNLHSPLKVNEMWRGDGRNYKIAP